jgi:hypothetical protein
MALESTCFFGFGFFGKTMARRSPEKAEIDVDEAFEWAV